MGCVCSSRFRGHFALAGPAGRRHSHAAAPLAASRAQANRIDWLASRPASQRRGERERERAGRPQERGQAAAARGSAVYWGRARPAWRLHFNYINMAARKPNVDRCSPKAIQARRPASGLAILSARPIWSQPIGGWGAEWASERASGSGAANRRPLSHAGAS